MISRRRLLSAPLALLAAPLAASSAIAQGYETQPPPPTLTMEQVSREVATLKIQMSVGLSILHTINREIRKINGKLGNPGPHPEKARRI